MILIAAITFRYADVVAHRLDLKEREWQYVARAQDVVDLHPERIVLVDPLGARRGELDRFRVTVNALEALAAREGVQVERVKL